MTLSRVATRCRATLRNGRRFALNDGDGAAGASRVTCSAVVGQRGCYSRARRQVGLLGTQTGSRNALTGCTIGRTA